MSREKLQKVEELIAKYFQNGEFDQFIDEQAKNGIREIYNTYADIYGDSSKKVIISDKNSPDLDSFQRVENQEFNKYADLNSLDKTQKRESIFIYNTGGHWENWELTSQNNNSNKKLLSSSGSDLACGCYTILTALKQLGKLDDPSIEIILSDHNIDKNNINGNPATNVREFVATLMTNLASNYPAGSADKEKIELSRNDILNSGYQLTDIDITNALKGANVPILGERVFYERELAIQQYRNTAITNLSGLAEEHPEKYFLEKTQDLLDFYSSLASFKQENWDKFFNELNNIKNNITIPPETPTPPPPPPEDSIPEPPNQDTNEPDHTDLPENNQDLDPTQPDLPDENQDFPPPYEEIDQNNGNTQTTRPTPTSAARPRSATKASSSNNKNNDILDAVQIASAVILAMAVVWFATSFIATGAAISIAPIAVGAIGAIGLGTSTIAKNTDNSKTHNSAREKTTNIPNNKSPEHSQHKTNFREKENLRRSELSNNSRSL